MCVDIPLGSGVQVEKVPRYGELTFRSRDSKKVKK